MPHLLRHLPQPGETPQRASLVRGDKKRTPQAAGNTTLSEIQALTDEDGNHIADFNTEDFRIMRGGWLDDFWLLTMASDDYEKVAGEINRKRFSVKAGDTSYRIINRWTQQGLFHDERDEDSKNLSH